MVEVLGGWEDRMGMYSEPWMSLRTTNAEPSSMPWMIVTGILVGVALSTCSAGAFPWIGMSPDTFSPGDAVKSPIVII